jgi:Lysophospholipase L1 and related esterases
MDQKENTSRRNFLKMTSLVTAGALTIPELISSAFAKENNNKKLKINNSNIILFQGDSITDSGRKKENADANNPSALGGGYAMIAASELLYRYADKGLKIYNRGISGNKVFQLADRWDKDTLDVKPDVLSILVGVNDFWHTLTNGYKGTIKTYTDDYRTLLDRTKQKLPGVKLIIGEPYALIGIKSVDEKWYPAFDDYRKAAKEIADSYNAVFIPYQSIYEKAQKWAPGVYWTADGVHPTLAGAHLMAHAWLEAVKG